MVVSFSKIIDPTKLPLHRLVSFPFQFSEGILNIDRVSLIQIENITPGDDTQFKTTLQSQYLNFSLLVMYDHASMVRFCFS